MAEKFYAANGETFPPEKHPKQDYTIQNTIRRIVIVQSFPDGLYLPTPTSQNELLRGVIDGLTQSVRVTDKTIVTHVYEF